MIAPEIDAEAETYTGRAPSLDGSDGRPDTDPYTVRKQAAELRGEDWDFDDETAVRRRLPRLAVLYGEELQKIAESAGQSVTQKIVPCKSKLKAKRLARRWVLEGKLGTPLVH